MLVLALDTTTRPGSHALVRDGHILALADGDPSRAHAERLPAELLATLAGCGLTVHDVDLYAVAAGPGSFTGLRIGIACLQGLAFATNRPLIGVSALDALAVCANPLCPDGGTIGVWMDGQRGEVFAARYRREGGRPTAVGIATVAPPATVLAEWAGQAAVGAVGIGDGWLRHGPDPRDLATFPVSIVDPVPAIAPAVADLALSRYAEGGSFHPHAVVPIYIRRPDAELARDRRAEARG